MWVDRSQNIDTYNTTSCFWRPLFYVVLFVFQYFITVCANNVQLCSSQLNTDQSSGRAWGLSVCTLTSSIWHTVIGEQKRSFARRYYTAGNENACGRKAVHYKFVQKQQNIMRKRTWSCNRKEGLGGGSAQESRSPTQRHSWLAESFQRFRQEYPDI